MPFDPVVQPSVAAFAGESAETVPRERSSVETTVGTENLVGQLLGGAYRILEMLDEGGMGRLYRAEHVRLRRPIAVKVLATHLAHDAGALVRFNREAEIVSQLNHPHIVQILDFDQTDRGAPYIVMELLQGESLAHRLDRDRMLPILEVGHIVAQIAGALQVAHQKGIVHRDLKPDNVYLLALEDAQIFIKLLDFGISKSTSAASKVTREFDVLGTPDYMAPEQAISTAKADHRADQFALASMTYEMLTGRMPFTADSVPELLHKVVHEMPVAPSFYAPGLPPGLDVVLMRGMAKLPDARYPTITDFAIAFSQAAGIVVPVAPAPSLSPLPSPMLLDKPPAVMASIPQRFWAGGPKQTPSGDLSAIAQAYEQSLPVPEVPLRRPRSPDEAARTIPLAAKLPAFDKTAQLPKHPSDGVAASLRMPQRPVLRSSTAPHERPSSSASRPPPKPAGGSIAPSPGSRSPAPPSSMAPPVMRGRSPNPAEHAQTYPPGMRPISELEGAISEVRRALAHGEQQRAATQARRVVHMARDCDEKSARHCLAEATNLLEPLLIPQLGGTNRTVALLNSRFSSQGDWTPAHFFLLSQIEQPTTVEELLDVSPLTRPETLCFIADLSAQGLVRVE